MRILISTYLHFKREIYKILECIKSFLTSITFTALPLEKIFTEELKMLFKEILNGKTKKYIITENSKRCLGKSKVFLLSYIRL